MLPYACMCVILNPKPQPLNVVLGRVRVQELEEELEGEEVMDEVQRQREQEQVDAAEEACGTAREGLAEVRTRVQREEEEIVEHIDVWRQVVLVEDEALEMLEQKVVGEEEKLAAGMVDVERRREESDAKVQALKEQVGIAQDELVRMEEELQSIEKRAIAGLVARETIAKMAERGVAKAQQLLEVKTHNENLLAAAMSEHEGTQRERDARYAELSAELTLMREEMARRKEKKEQAAALLDEQQQALAAAQDAGARELATAEAAAAEAEEALRAASARRTHRAELKGELERQMKELKHAKSDLAEEQSKIGSLRSQEGTARWSAMAGMQAARAEVSIALNPKPQPLTEI